MRRKGAYKFYRKAYNLIACANKAMLKKFIQIYLTKVNLWLFYRTERKTINLEFIVDEKRPAYTAQWWVRVHFQAVLDMHGEKRFPTEQLNDLVFYVA